MTNAKLTLLLAVALILALFLTISLKAGSQAMFVACGRCL